MKTYRVGTVFVLVSLLLVGGMVSAHVGAFDFQGRSVQADWRVLNDPRLTEHVQTIESTFNVVLVDEFMDPHGGMQSSTIQRMVQDVLEGTTTAELFMVATDDIPGLVRDGLIQPLDEPLREAGYFESLPSMYQDENWDFIRHQGKTWGVDAEDIAAHVEGLLWNRSLFEREGFPDLYELYENGEWTWEVFREIALQATQDTSGDGEIDQWGFVNFQHYSGSPKFMINWAYTNNAVPTRTVDGYEVFAFNEPEAIESLEFWQDLVQQGAARLGQFGLFRNQNIAMCSGNLWVADSVPNDWKGLADMDDDWGIVPLPMGPRAERHVAPQNHSWVKVIPVTHNNPAEVIELFSAVRNRSNKYIDVEAFHEDKWTAAYTLKLRDRQSDENMRWLAANMEFIPYVGIMLESGFHQALNSIWNEGTPPASAMNEIAPVVQGLLDDYFGQ